ncbi:uncharacterized protein ATNIH1004_010474 [Aspergillus tanneri]|uniref:Uncharacterized protein n=1 Tax=Aspergillus tanneri TaxID=1220188 RepID=A0A5M9ME10_9EURO|nr:uncharacterized protein ATNIH1004_010474 [Aspergillus tanneri]KAA8643700.1 hypothetical protein ATNIH1004_010474 [Aspergillus tanneri]
MSFTRDDYTVAWICALPLEMAAAKVMLDEIHPPLPQPQSDHNVYTLGSVNGHNVVVACLPSGVYGTISATAVASHMLHFGPTATSSGIIQYDYGKTLRDGRFQHTGSLNKPPPVLLRLCLN